MAKARGQAAESEQTLASEQTLSGDAEASGGKAASEGPAIDSSDSAVPGTLLRVPATLIATLEQHCDRLMRSGRHQHHAALHDVLNAAADLKRKLESARALFAEHSDIHDLLHSVHSGL
jgi:hypothetical protein